MDANTIVNILLVVGLVIGLTVTAWPQLSNFFTSYVLRPDNSVPVPEPEPEPDLIPIVPADDRTSMLARVMVLRDQLAADPGCVRAIDFVLVPAIMARGGKR
jgi:hypothetical protein